MPDDLVAVQQQIEIQGPGAPALIFAHSPLCLLDALQLVQQRQRAEAGGKARHGIDVVRLIRRAHGAAAV